MKEKQNLFLRVVVALAAAALLMGLFLSAAPPPPSAQAELVGAIDAPVAGANLSSPTYVIGWAIDPGSASGVGISRVSVYLDGVFVKDAHLGLARDDIGSGYGAPFRLAGWQALLDVDVLATSGTHELQVHVISADGSMESVLTRDLSVTTHQRFGVDAHLLWFDPSRAAHDLDQIRANALDTVRIDVGWDALQPTADGAWDTGYLVRLDDVLDLAADRGEHIILVVLGTPAWARGYTGSRMTPPSDVRAFGAALSFLAARYAGRLDIVYEVWNEPNQRQFWGTSTGPDAAAYARLLSAAYTAVKSVAPHATVLGGSIAFNDPNYLEALYAAGAGGHFDGLALHPYSDAFAPDATANPSRSFVTALDHSRQILAAHGDAEKPIWVTEMGWSTQDITDLQRADYLARAVQLVRDRPGVVAFCAYGLNQGDDFPDSGLVDAHGLPTASWDAYGRAVRGG